MYYNQLVGLLSIFFFFWNLIFFFLQNGNLLEHRACYLDIYTNCKKIYCYFRIRPAEDVEEFSWTILMISKLSFLVPDDVQLLRSFDCSQKFIVKEKYSNMNIDDGAAFVLFWVSHMGSRASHVSWELGLGTIESSKKDPLVPDMHLVDSWRNCTFPDTQVRTHQMLARRINLGFENFAP